MHTTLRNGLAVIAGLVLGSMVNMALVTAGPQVIPLPAGIDVTDAKNLAASVHLLTPRHFLFPFLAHALGTLTGAWVTHLAASSWRSELAYVVGTLFLAGGIAAASMIPAPSWFIALDLLFAYLPMTWLGTRFGRRIRP